MSENANIADLDPVVKVMLDELKGKITEANELADLIKNSNTEFDTVLKNVEDEYETDEVNNLQNQIEELEKALETIFKTEATRIVNEAQATSGNITEAKSRFTVLKKGIGNLTSYLVDNYGPSATADLPTLKGTKGTGAQAGKGSGVLRIHGYTWSYDGTDYPNLSGAVKVADLDIREVQEQIIALNGEDRTNWPDSFTSEVKGKKIEANRKAAS